VIEVTLIKPAPVRRSVEVRASTERAFKVFTSDINHWWPRSHSIGKGKLKAAVIEPRVGGRWYGEDEDGTTTDWGRVLAWEPPKRLVLAWQISGEWRYDPDLVTEVEVRFIAKGADLTKVELEHRDLERLGDKADRMREQFESPNGWGLIINLYAEAARSP
jgi:uncharacterized protein YndB with AHSA1/START domain